MLCVRVCRFFNGALKKAGVSGDGRDPPRIQLLLTVPGSPNNSTFVVLRVVCGRICPSN